MNTNENGREARVRATRRLRKLTIGTAIMGLAATGGFGALAAVTYDGMTTTAANTGTTAANTGTTAVTTTGTAATTSSTAAPTSSTTTQAPAVTTTTGTAHVSSGGS